MIEQGEGQESEDPLIESSDPSDSGFIQELWSVIGFIVRLAAILALVLVLGLVWAVAMVLSFVYHLLWGDGPWYPTPLTWFMPEEEHVR